MTHLSPRILRLPALLALCLLACATRADDKGKEKDKAESSIEVNDWSVWVGNPAQLTMNSARIYRNAMPNAVGTSRTKFEDKDLADKFPIAPISITQFFGEPARDIDVDLRVKKGTFLAHWPIGTDRGGRLQWFKSDLESKPPAGIPETNLPENHWFQALRENDPALYLKNESHFERFLAYDSELTIAVPVKIRGGPDEYTLQNLTDRRLVDIAVIAPTENGFRVGWLDELPTAVPPTDEEAKKKADEESAKKKKAEPVEKKAEAVFQEAEAKPKDKDEPPPPLPAEADANVRAQVDQVLNRPVNVTVENAPRKDVLNQVAIQARVRYELDDRTIAKAEIDLNKPMSLQAMNMAARDALADVLGELGLSYRITDSGSLYITTAARLAEDKGHKGAAIEGPPVKLTMSQPVKPSNSSYREMTRDAYARRLAGQGLREEVVRTILDRYSPGLFEPGELIVLAHLSREAIDEAVVLDVFPPPKKVVRTALVVIHGVDPRLQDRARTFVQQLGDPSPKARDAAEARLLALGPVAVPALEDALKDKDVEIVFRAERLLLRLNRTVP